MSRILVVEDDPAIVRLLDAILRRGGHDVVTAATTRAAEAALTNRGIDAVLLDLGLPDRDGLEFIAAVRLFTSVPIIAVTARHDVADKIAALDLGADDYVTKPFDGDELLARLRSALRRTGAASPTARQILSCGPLKMDIDRHELSCRGELVSLTPREFSLLRVLIDADGRIVTHASLLEQVWGKAHINDVDYLRVAIRALRLKLESEPANPQLIRNEPGIGYRLVN
jgi:two-component system KDP operon response regulator KdpE